MILGRGCLLVVFGVLGAVIPAVGFGDPPPRASTPTPTPTPGPSSRRSLAEYARGRDLQPLSTDESSRFVITDDSLLGSGSGVELTAVTGRPSTSKEPVVPSDHVDPRAFWRGRVKEQKDKIRTLAADGEVLEREIAGLWELFYACDEPDEREEGIRPRLIQKIEDQTRLRAEDNVARSDFENLLVEARRNGALPGWFRDLEE